jgi:AhpD family alkylhydroperoxidase
MQSKKSEMPAPPYLWAKGLLDNLEWVDSYIKSVLSWPNNCTLTIKERHLIGLGKAVAYLWEPGVLIHLDQALNSGADLKEVNDTIRVAAITAGLADLDNALQQLSSSGLRYIGKKKAKARYDIPLPKNIIDFLAFDQELLESFLNTVRIIFEKTSLEARLQQLICLAVSSIKSWKHGVEVHSKLAAEAGATQEEIIYVVVSVFKTRVSIAMQVGFRYPCYTPDMSKYRLIYDSYVKSRSKAGVKQFEPESLL